MNIKNIIREEIEQFDWGKDKVADMPVKPNQIVYHISDPKFRISIMQNGLQTKVGDSYSEWTQGQGAKTPIPAIFATNSDLNSVTGGIENFGGDVWAIDTAKIGNQWYEDKHFTKFKDFGISNPHIVTFENIPREALSLAFKANQNVNEVNQNSSGYLELQRCQKGDVESGWDFRIVNGQNGEGVYAFLAGDKPMKDYYCKNGENLHSFKVPKKYVVDLSRVNLDYWKVKEYMYHHPEYKVFIFKHAGHGIPTSKEVLVTDPSIIIMNNSGELSEEYNHTDYLKWKKQNVTLRGLRDSNSTDNGGMAKYGQGLYTAFLGNREMARQYGKVYFVVNAIPKHPKIVYTSNDAEIFLQEVVTNFCKRNGVPRSNDFFNSKTTISEEMQNLGYDGLVIRGREMVNYAPPDNVLYFSDESQLINYYDVVIEK